MIIFNHTSAEFVLISADVNAENDHNFEKTEDRATKSELTLMRPKFLMSTWLLKAGSD